MVDAGRRPACRSALLTKGLPSRDVTSKDGTLTIVVFLIDGGGHGRMRLPQPVGRSWRARLPDHCHPHMLDYDPAMKGSRSLNAVLPTIAPDFNHANFDCGVPSGGDVETVYAPIVEPTG